MVEPREEDITLSLYHLGTVLPHPEILSTLPFKNKHNIRAENSTGECGRSSLFRKTIQFDEESRQRGSDKSLRKSSAFSIMVVLF